MSTTNTAAAVPITVMPGLHSRDPIVDAWIAQVTLRLRREVAWCWHQRAQVVDPGDGRLPPVTEPAAENLNLVRYQNERQHFFHNDITAQYLTDEIVKTKPAPDSTSRSHWTFVTEELELNEASQFVLALALAASMDAALAPVFATCMNDMSRPFPTLALAQRLWDDPLAIIDLGHIGHPLYRYQLLSKIESANRVEWLQPIQMPTLVSQSLLNVNGPLPAGLKVLDLKDSRPLGRDGIALTNRLVAQANAQPQIVPLIGPKGTDFTAWAATLSNKTGTAVISVSNRYPLDQENMNALSTFCWLHGADILLPEHWAEDANNGPGQKRSQPGTVPIRWFIPFSDADKVRQMESVSLTPPLRISGLTFDQRVAAFHRGLPQLNGGLAETVEECARRFRFQEKTIADVTTTFSSSARVDGDDLIAACRNEAMVEMGGLAEFVNPRFGIDELILPSAKMKPFVEILHSMRNLTEVHFHWGTARVWNESGLSVLFYGPPGTGKTMGAEVLSKELGLPMYRIDLSQVVNKYIGETEKNLKRIFDAAEQSDCILFFDEADALFGKRTEVKDAHDRFANIETSYLLERMERFKGLAILATNRRKDLDEAFVRRLRYIIEFPMPGADEREQIWRQSFPENLDVAEIDFSFLARKFQLTGGHIRSISFNACLLSAGSLAGEKKTASGRTTGRIPMKNLLIAVKRELEKMNRVSSEEVFGPFSDLIQEAGV